MSRLTQDVTSSANSGGRQQAIEELGAAHRFTLEDLQANRAGKIHASQIEAAVRRGRHDVRFGSILLVLGLALLLAGTALAFFPRAVIDQDFTSSVPKKKSAIVATSLIGLVLGMLPFTFGVLALSHGRKVVAVYAAGRAERVEGPLRKVRVPRRTTADWYVYGIGEKTLRPVNNRGFETVTAGAVYRAYYVAQLDELLSIEPL